MKILFLVLFAVISLPYFLFCEKNDYVDDREDYIKELIEGEVDIEFYGKVIDQYKNPVSNAIVRYKVNQYDPYPSKSNIYHVRQRELMLSTDSKGEFHITGIKGYSLSIEEIFKEGYEFHRNSDLKTYFRFDHGYIKVFKPDLNNPLVFTIRQMKSPSYLIEMSTIGLQIKNKGSSGVTGYDVIQCRQIPDVNNMSRANRGNIPDLKIAYVYDSENRQWKLIISSDSEDSGIFVSNELLHEAPENGYRPQYIAFLKIDSKDEINFDYKYLYLKSRSPAIYSRIEVSGCVAKENFIRLNIRSLANPYGERGFDEIKNISSNISASLLQEARESLKEGVIPKKPDAELLMNEAKRAMQEGRPKRGFFPREE
jgi:hypothetical protein